MNDHERIEMYYRSGVMDWRSEAAQPSGKTVRKSAPARGLRIFKLAALLWCTVLKYVSQGSK